MQWHKDMLRAFRDNAAYEAGRYVILLVWPFVLTGIYWALAKFGQVPWSASINALLLLVAVVILSITVWKLIKQRARQSCPKHESIPVPDIVKKPLFQPTQDSTQKIDDNIGGNIASAGRDVHQTIHHHGVQPPSDVDEASPLLVAHDDLKTLLHGGERMLADFYVKDRRPTSESVNLYIEKVRTCAKRRVFNLRQKEWDQFEAPLDGDKEEELLMQKAALVDGGLFPPPLVDPFFALDYDCLYTRVVRLRELLAFMTGKYEEPAPLPAIATFSERLIEREIAPCAVPPKWKRDEERHEAYERDRAAAGIEIHLPRKGHGIRERADRVIRTLTDRTNQISKTLEIASPTLDLIAGFPVEFRYKATQDANFADLFEIEEELITESLSVYRETSWNSFCDLWQGMLGLNRLIADYNKTKAADIKNKILTSTIQSIPLHLERAKMESIKPL